MNYWELVKPTYIENWEPKLYALSIPQVDIPITLEDAKDIVSIMWGDKPEAGVEERSKNLAEKLDLAIGGFPANSV